MKTCARCGAVGSGLKCPSCGLLLVAPPPTPAARFATGPAAEAAAGTATPSEAEQYFAPTTVTTVARPTPAPNAHRSPRKIAIIAAIVAVVCLAVYQLTQQLTHTSKPKTPVVLPARAPSQGLPSSLEDVVRVQAESARQHALQLIVQARSEGPVTPAALSSIDGSLKWLPSGTSSKSSTEVSILQGDDGSVTIAISAASKTVCAYAQLPPGGTAQYVTMGNVSSCSAADAPADGWSSLRGGSASDLPPDGY